MNQETVMHGILPLCYVFGGDYMPKDSENYRSDCNIVHYSSAISICPDILALKILHILSVISDMSDSDMVLFN